STNSTTPHPPAGTQAECIGPIPGHRYPKNLLIPHSGPAMTAEEFVAKWKNSAAAELANSQSFLIELCDLLDVPRPEPTRAEEDLNLYTFEKAVTFHYADGTRSPGRIDLYRRGCFVLESKQGSERRAAEQEFLSTALRQRRIRTGTAE